MLHTVDLAKMPQKNHKQAEQRRISIVQQHLLPPPVHHVAPLHGAQLSFDTTSGVPSSRAISLAYQSIKYGQQLDCMVATIALNNPPVNALSRQVLEQLEKALDTAHANDKCVAIVIYSAIPVRCFV